MGEYIFFLEDTKQNEIIKLYFLYLKIEDILLIICEQLRIFKI